MYGGCNYGCDDVLYMLNNRVKWFLHISIGSCEENPLIR